jgi:Protein of unknown function (DUF3102)
MGHDDATGLARELDDLAAEINCEHAAVEAAFGEGISRAVAAGRLLVRAKASLEHGGWVAWVGRSCDFTPRTAQGYMRVARHAEQLATDGHDTAGLSHRRALALLASPTEGTTEPETAKGGPMTPEECRAAVVAGAENILAIGRELREVERRLTPDQFRAWREAEFPGRSEFLDACLAASDLAPGQPGKVLMAVADMLLVEARQVLG